MIEKALWDNFWFVKVRHVHDTREEINKIKNMIIWCINTLDKNDGTLSHCRKYAWSYERFLKYTRFNFDRESDAVLFALRWA